MSSPDSAVLLGRVVDRTARPSDWQQLRQLAGHESELWPALADALEDDARLRLALEGRLAIVERVALAGEGVPPARAWRVLRRPLAWSGWIAAAASLVLWLPLGASAPEASAPAAADGALAGSPLAATSAPAERLAELPLVLVGTRPSADGEGLEVVYVRRSVERQRVTSAYELAQDELGHLRPVPVDLGSLSASEVL